MYTFFLNGVRCECEDAGSLRAACRNSVTAARAVATHRNVRPKKRRNRAGDESSRRWKLVDASIADKPLVNGEKKRDRWRSLKNAGVFA